MPGWFVAAVAAAVALGAQARQPCGSCLAHSFECARLPDLQALAEQALPLQTTANLLQSELLHVICCVNECLRREVSKFLGIGLCKARPETIRVRTLTGEYNVRFVSEAAHAFV